jgi:hypothetical protein
MIVGGGMMIMATVGMSTKTNRAPFVGCYRNCDELQCSTLRRRKVKPKG